MMLTLSNYCHNALLMWLHLQIFLLMIPYNKPMEWFALCLGGPDFSFQLPIPQSLSDRVGIQRLAPLPQGGTTFWCKDFPQDQTEACLWLRLHLLWPTCSAFLIPLILTAPLNQLFECKCCLRLCLQVIWSRLVWTQSYHTWYGYVQVQLPSR